MDLLPIAEKINKLMELLPIAPIASFFQMLCQQFMTIVF